MNRQEAVTLLHINLDSTIAEIKKAYFEAVKANPPEKSPEKFKQIRKAYEFLIEKQKCIGSEDFDFQNLAPPFTQLDAANLILDSILFSRTIEDAQKEFFDFSQNNQLFLI